MKGIGIEIFDYWDYYFCCVFSKYIFLCIFIFGFKIIVFRILGNLGRAGIWRISLLLFVVRVCRYRLSV